MYIMGSRQEDRNAGQRQGGPNESLIQEVLLQIQIVTFQSQSSEQEGRERLLYLEELCILLLLPSRLPVCFQRLLSPLEQLVLFTVSCEPPPEAFCHLVEGESDSSLADNCCTPLGSNLPIEVDLQRVSPGCMKAALGWLERTCIVLNVIDLNTVKDCPGVKVRCVSIEEKTSTM
jgi:hypothetical protein